MGQTKFNTLLVLKQNLRKQLTNEQLDNLIERVSLVQTETDSDLRAKLRLISDIQWHKKGKK